ncbi:MAG: SCP2 sterol-binding domain-containing protein [Anaerolineae bacterium]
MPKFLLDEWIKALQVDINQSEPYAKAAEQWEGDFYFIITPEGSMTGPVIYYMDLWHGKCRDAYLVTDESEKEPVFRMAAPLSVWEKVVTKKLDVIQGLLTRQIKLKGNMAMIMRNVKAAQELVECCTHIETEFPS